MSNKKDLEYLQNQLGVRDSMILNRLIDNHLEKIDRLQQRIDKAIEFVEKEPIDDEIEYSARLLEILRGENNE